MGFLELEGWEVLDLQWWVLMLDVRATEAVTGAFTCNSGQIG